MDSLLSGQFLSRGSTPEKVLFWGILLLLLWFFFVKFPPGTFLLSALLLCLVPLLWNTLRFVYFNKVLLISLPTTGFILAAIAAALYKVFCNEREIAIGIIAKLESKDKTPSPPSVPGQNGMDTNQTSDELLKKRFQELNLNPRQQDVVRLTCEGFESGEVAYRLNISRSTVDNHLRKIYEKTGTHNKLTLMKLIYK